jgi:hypothetical protein
MCVYVYVCVCPLSGSFPSHAHTQINGAMRFSTRAFGRPREPTLHDLDRDDSDSRGPYAAASDAQRPRRVHPALKWEPLFARCRAQVCVLCK